MEAIIVGANGESETVDIKDDSQIEKMETLYSLEKHKTSYSKPKNEEEIIETALSMIGENITENITILNHHLGDQLSYRYEDFLIVLTSNVYNEDECLICHNSSIDKNILYQKLEEISKNKYWKNMFRWYDEIIVF